MRRTRRIELTNDELYFSNGPQCGTFVIDVDILVDDEGPCFRKSDVTGVDLAIVVGNVRVPCSAQIAELTADWLATPDNFDRLARRVDDAEERDPTRNADRRAGFTGRRFD